MQGGMMDQLVIVFDGQCVLCSAGARFVLRCDTCWLSDPFFTNRLP